MPSQTKRLTPIKAIRAFCRECMCGDNDLIADCKPVPDCPLHPYRLGKNPNVSDETRDKRSSILKDKPLRKKS